MKDVYCFKKVFVNGCISLLCLFVFVGNSSAQNQVPPPVEDVFHTVDNTLDSMKIVRMARPVPGKSRKGDNPVLFLVGNSTMRTGTKGMAAMVSGDGDILPLNILMRIKLQSRIML